MSARVAEKRDDFPRNTKPQQHDRNSRGRTGAFAVKALPRVLAVNPRGHGKSSHFQKHEAKFGIGKKLVGNDVVGGKQRQRNCHDQKHESRKPDLGAPRRGADRKPQKRENNERHIKRLAVKLAPGSRRKNRKPREREYAPCGLRFRKSGDYEITHPYHDSLPQKQKRQHVAEMLEKNRKAAYEKEDCRKR